MVHGIEFCEVPLWVILNYLYYTVLKAFSNIIVQNSSILDEETPDFSKCFEYTILIWIPTIYVFLIAPFWIYSCIKNSCNKIKFSWVTLSKFVIKNFYEIFVLSVNFFTFYSQLSIVLVIGIEIALLIVEIYDKSEPKYFAFYLKSILLILTFVII